MQPISTRFLPTITVKHLLIKSPMTSTWLYPLSKSQFSSLLIHQWFRNGWYLLATSFLLCHLNSDPFHFSPACCPLSPWAEQLESCSTFFFFTVIALVVFRLQIMYQSHAYVFKLSDWLLVWTINVLSRCPFNISTEMS